MTRQKLKIGGNILGESPGFRPDEVEFVQDSQDFQDEQDLGLGLALSRQAAKGKL